MTLHECAESLSTLAFELGVDIEEETIRAYHISLGDVPQTIFAAACRRAALTPRERFEPRFPSPAKLRQLAEHERQRALEAKPWAPCAQCEHSPRWISFVDDDGFTRVRPCPCVLAYRARIEQAGLSARLALPPVEEVDA